MSAFEGVGADASDLIRIVSWAQNDPRLLARVYLTYPSAKRITVAMVERVLALELHDARPLLRLEQTRARVLLAKNYPNEG